MISVIHRLRRRVISRRLVDAGSRMHTCTQRTLVHACTCFRSSVWSILNQPHGNDADAPKIRDLQNIMPCLDLRTAVLHAWRPLLASPLWYVLPGRPLLPPPAAGRECGRPCLTGFGGES